MQHIWLESGILVFMNGLTPQRTAALIHFMAFTLELKITLITKEKNILDLRDNKEPVKDKGGVYSARLYAKVITTSLKLACDNYTVNRFSYKFAEQ